MRYAFQFENVSKRYRLGEIGTGALAHDLYRIFAKVRGKPDPFSTVEVRPQKPNNPAASDEANSNALNLNEPQKDSLWALRDIDLQVECGTVLGVIGNNGAGKSTLLKLLASITAPTRGHVRSNGRIISLLEVGTGFHPELTGRENILLNGAILGMRRQEVIAQLDEIIAFSGCSEFIDTPVKRYSSGMLMRLGFAVAAHLRCDILVVDEVLAVGDAEFQRRCLGKMQSISQTGDRTILFVSHNINAIRALCQSGIVLESGHLRSDGVIKIEDAVRTYLDISRGKQSTSTLRFNPPESIGSDLYFLESFEAASCQDDAVRFEVRGELTCCNPNFLIGIAIYYEDYSVPLYRTFSSDLADQPIKEGKATYIVTVSTKNWNDGLYRAELLFAFDNGGWVTWPGAFCYYLEFHLHPKTIGGVRFQSEKSPTYLKYPLEWKTEPL